MLVAIGRVPNGKNLDAGKAGVEVDDRGFIRVDKQLRTNVPHIFAIGDIVGQPMLAHKGVHEGHVAAEVIAGKKTLLRSESYPVHRLYRTRSCMGWSDREKKRKRKASAMKPPPSRGLLLVVLSLPTAQTV